jgi:GDP-4-dehydro-6-deoxy-D-mannose reductase
MKVLVTGATGFAGSHLVDALLKRPGVQVHATRRWSSRMVNLEHIPDVEKAIQFHTCNILDPAAVTEVLDNVRPDWIFHLAAESYVGPSWTMPSIYMDTNIKGTLHFLEAMKRLPLENTLLHVAGSGEEYGLIYEHEIPIREDTVTRPVNPYAVAKVAQSMICDVYFRSFKTKVVRTRTFNHEGPRRDRVFALPSFAYQLARIEQGLEEPVVKVGNLSARRSWIDARDVARAYIMALEKGVPGEMYLVSSDAVKTVRECLDMLIAESTVKTQIQVQPDPTRMRPTEVPLLVGDDSKFRKQTGWQPEVPLEQTLRDTLRFWRERVRSEMELSRTAAQT